MATNRKIQSESNHNYQTMSNIEVEDPFEVTEPQTETKSNNLNVNKNLVLLKVSD